VKSILAGDEVPTELVIVDQSAVPHSPLAFLRTERSCEIRYLWTQSIGVSRARNAGIGAARHDVLVFTDDDILVRPEWFGTIARSLLRARPRTVVTGRVLPAETGTGFAPSIKTDETPAVYEGRIGQDVLFSNNVAMFRSVLEEVGTFDMRLGAGTPFANAEDNDLGYRILEAGYRIAYVPEAILYHRAWRSNRDYLPLRWSYGVGRGAVYAKHLSLQDRYMLSRLRADVTSHIPRSPRAIRERPRESCGDIVLAIGILFGAAKWWLKRPKP